MYKNPIIPEEMFKLLKIKRNSKITLTNTYIRAKMLLWFLLWVHDNVSVYKTHNRQIEANNYIIININK